MDKNNVNILKIDNAIAYLNDIRNHNTRNLSQFNSIRNYLINIIRQHSTTPSAATTTNHKQLLIACEENIRICQQLIQKLTTDHNTHLITHSSMSQQQRIIDKFCHDYIKDNNWNNDNNNMEATIKIKFDNNLNNNKQNDCLNNEEEYNVDGVATEFTRSVNHSKNSNLSSSLFTSDDIIIINNDHHINSQIVATKTSSSSSSSFGVKILNNCVVKLSNKTQQIDNNAQQQTTSFDDDGFFAQIEQLLSKDREEEVATSIETQEVSNCNGLGEMGENFEKYLNDNSLKSFKQIATTTKEMNETEQTKRRIFVTRGRRMGCETIVNDNSNVIFKRNHVAKFEKKFTLNFTKILDNKKEGKGEEADRIEIKLIENNEYVVVTSKRLCLINQLKHNLIDLLKSINDRCEETSTKQIFHLSIEYKRNNDIVDDEMMIINETLIDSHQCRQIEQIQYLIQLLEQYQIELNRRRTSNHANNNNNNNNNASFTKHHLMFYSYIIFVKFINNTTTTTTTIKQNLIMDRLQINFQLLRLNCEQQENLLYEGKKMVGTTTIDNVYEMLEEFLIYLDDSLINFIENHHHKHFSFQQSPPQSNQSSTLSTNKTILFDSSVVNYSSQQNNQNNQRKKLKSGGGGGGGGSLSQKRYCTMLNLFESSDDDDDDDQRFNKNQNYFDFDDIAIHSDCLIENSDGGARTSKRKLSGSGSLEEGVEKKKLPIFNVNKILNQAFINSGGGSSSLMELTSWINQCDAQSGNVSDLFNEHNSTTTTTTHTYKILKPSKLNYSDYSNNFEELSTRTTHDDDDEEDTKSDKITTSLTKSLKKSQKNNSKLMEKVVNISRSKHNDNDDDDNDDNDDYNNGLLKRTLEESIKLVASNSTNRQLVDLINNNNNNKQLELTNNNQMNDDQFGINANRLNRLRYDQQISYVLSQFQNEPPPSLPYTL